MEKHIVIGAGPAGLTAAWQLSKLGREVHILEADPQYVGGIARTVSYKGNRFDMGGHRFYSKSAEINHLWQEMLPHDFIQVPRLSRIYYKRQFFPYPLNVRATLLGLGLWRSCKIGLSYLGARLRPRQPEASFEDWIVNRFGYELFTTFFKTYTEKVWGIPCTEISKDFAGQRIRGLSLSEALKNALFPPKDNSNIKTLIKTFTYPRLGPGQLWERVRDEVLAQGNQLELGKTVVKMYHSDGVMDAVETQDGCIYEGSHFYMTMALKDFVNALDPAPPPEVLHAGNALRYRDFLTVALVVDRVHLFPDNWIYIHEPSVHVGRIQNYKNWSPDMVADPSKTCLGMEYFVNEGDPLWSMSDADLLHMAAQEVEQIGLAKASECRDGHVVRLRKTYPIYDEYYKDHLRTLKGWCNTYFKNVYPAGRGGLHNYNSQDHSMVMAILSVRNMSEGAIFDVWAINTEEEYAEEGQAKLESELRLAPQPVSPPPHLEGDQFNG
jgi:protoporphyrinogen oxidase